MEGCWHISQSKTFCKTLSGVTVYEGQFYVSRTGLYLYKCTISIHLLKRCSFCLAIGIKCTLLAFSLVKIYSFEWRVVKHLIKSATIRGSNYGSGVRSITRSTMYQNAPFC